MLADFSADVDVQIDIRHHIIPASESYLFFLKYNLVSEAMFQQYRKSINA
jgi:hypothetical protein